MTPSPDRLHRFLIENTNVRGELVHLDDTWRTLLTNGDYPVEVESVLGQALSAVALLAATVKFEGSLSLQISGDGPLHMLVVQATSQSTVRGLARWRGDTRGKVFSELVGKASLMLTIDPGAHRERYQGIVAVEEAGLSAVLQGYFQRSEQLPTRLWLAADHERTGGLLLQRLPGDEDEEEEDWNRLSLLSATVKNDELLDLPAHDLLNRLYRQEDVRVFSPRPISHRCSCSKEKVEATLRALGEEELRSELEENQEIVVNCEFCNAVFHYDAVDFAMLFYDDTAGPVGETRH